MKLISLVHFPSLCKGNYLGGVRTDEVLTHLHREVSAPTRIGKTVVHTLLYKHCLYTRNHIV